MSRAPEACSQHNEEQQRTFSLDQTLALLILG